MMHNSAKTLLLCLLGVVGCANPATHSVKIQPYFLEGVPAGKKVGVMPVLATTFKERRQKSDWLTRRALEVLGESKLFGRVAPAGNRDDPAFDLVLEATVWDAELPADRAATTTVNILTLGLYSLFGGELGRYHVRVTHTIRLWSRGKRVGDYKVINKFSAPITIYRDPEYYRAERAALALSPEILLERTALAAKKETGQKKR